MKIITDFCSVCKMLQEKTHFNIFKAPIRNDIMKVIIITKRERNFK